MNSKGIRILDKKNSTVTVELTDIFHEILDGDALNWSILYFYGTGHLKNGTSIPAFEEETNRSEKGLLINWKDLNLLAINLWDIFDSLIIGCRKQEMISRYTNDQEMYESCDIVIEMVDSSYWEVFSKDEDLINRLAAKFKEVKLLQANSEK
jgi:hypothetical protein